jgi:hypothetical protein
MSLFDDLFGDKSKADSHQTTTENKQTSGSTTTQGTTTKSSLDPATLALLTSLIGNYAGQLGDTGIDAETMRNLASQIATTSSDTTAMDASIGASQQEAKRQFGLNEGKQIGLMTNQIGSKGNTFAQLIAAQGEGDLQSQLAKIVSDTKLQEQQTKIAGLNTAASVTGAAGQIGIDEANAPLQRLLSLISAREAGQTTETVDMTTLMKSLETGSGTSDTIGNQSSSPSMIGALQQIINLFGGG